MIAYVVWRASCECSHSYAYTYMLKIQLVVQTWLWACFFYYIGVVSDSEQFSRSVCICMCSFLGSNEHFIWTINMLLFTNLSLLTAHLLGDVVEIMAIYLFIYETDNMDRSRALNIKERIYSYHYFKCLVYACIDRCTV